MKDKQIIRKAETSSIPLVSPLLHVASMPVLVFLRFDFGYLFLRPKSIFLACIWAVALFSIYSWHDSGRWQANRLICWFVVVSSLLYLGHIARSIFAQWGQAPHDQFSGKSVFSFLKLPVSILFFWAEPLLVWLLAGVFETLQKGNSLSDFLAVSALAMFCKEGINRWFHVRKLKQQLDATSDAEETMTAVSSERESPRHDSEPSRKSSRKARRTRKRSTENREPSDSDLETHATVLRMIPPYSLEQAETNFRVLVKEFHPDESRQNPENNARLLALTEARGFFREHFEIQ